MMARAVANRSQFDAASASGHYESWFVRANHPERALAFWIRYTFFQPRARPDEACGEVWAIWFDGERQSVAAVKDAFQLAACAVHDAPFALTIGSSTMSEDALVGGTGARFSWRLACSASMPVLMLLPEEYYARSLPRAKALVPAPNARFSGHLSVDGTQLDIRNWQGSQNHNWGSAHTDSYAWGQVAGFDGAPEVYLECATARLKFGPWWTPALTLVVVRIGAEEYALNSLARAVRSQARLGFFHWEIDARARGVWITIRIHAPHWAFAGLRYANPPGGVKACLNTKLAACELSIVRDGHDARTYQTRHRAAFEILTDRDDPGIPMLA